MTTTIDPRAVVDPTAILGAHCRLGPFCVVEAGAELGEGCVLEPFSRVGQNSWLGKDVRLGQGAVVGGMPQVRDLVESGNCRVSDRTRIGEYATIHASKDRDGSTRLGVDCLVMAYAHVGHDCSIGSQATLANGVQLAGHIEIEQGAFLGGGTLVHQFVRVGEFAFVAGGIRLDLDLAPWSRAMGEPPRWAGTNVVGLRRSIEAPSVEEASPLLRLLFRKGLRLEQARTALAESGLDRAQTLLEFLERSRRGLLRPGN